MTALAEKILQELDSEFRYEETDWLPAFLLLPRLRSEDETLSLADVAKALQELQMEGMVDYTPSTFKDKLSGFLTRLTTRGYNMLHFGKPSLVS